MEKIKSFLHGVKKEMDRVKWPTKKSMVKDSSAVLIFCFFFGIFFYLVNILFILIKGVLS